MKALVLRTCNAGLSSRRGFVWPSSGPVEAPDWDPTPECGRGLHGALWGEGEGALFDWSPTAKWLVVEVDDDSVVDLGGKVKFPRGNVIYAGTRHGATALLPPERAVIGAVRTAGDRGTATAGDRGTATAGRYGTATAGHGGTATAGDRGTATAGRYGTATAGHGGTATAGRYGTATAGEDGTATAGDRGTATAGDRGTATAGRYGTATAGEYGQIRIVWYANERPRLAVGYVGEDGIEANAAYVVREGKLVKKWAS